MPEEEEGNREDIEEENETANEEVAEGEEENPPLRGVAPLPRRVWVEAWYTPSLSLRVRILGTFS